MAQDIFIPKLGMTMEEAAIAEWKANDGDEVEKDQTILVIDTEKVAHEMESPVSGFLVILAQPGEVHPCGAVVGKLAETQAEYEEIKQSGATVEVKEVEVTEAVPEQAVAEEPAEVAPAAAAKTTGRIDISPVAKRIAEKHQVDYAHLAGSGAGPGGRIVKKDVEGLIETRAVVSVPVAAPIQQITDTVPASNGKRIKEIIPLTGVRKTIAQRMHQSVSETARVTGMEEMDMTELIALRKYYNEKIAELGVKITFTDLFILIVTKGLKAVPILNSSLIGDEIRVWEDINIGFGVNVVVDENEENLVVPVIKNAGHMGLMEISAARKDLTDKARQGKLSMDEMTGGTFTLTNTGTLSNRWFVQTPIINQPEIAILGTSPTIEKPVVMDGEIVIRPIMPVSISFDHRVVDGGPVAKFMNTVAKLIHDPTLLVL